MKIIDVAEHYAEEGGGVKTYIHTKMQAAKHYGHEMVIIAPGREDRVEYKYGGKIIYVKGPRLILDDRYGIFNDEKRIHQILDYENADIIEGGSVWAGGRYVSRWDGKAVKVLIFHQDFVAAYGHTFLDSMLSVAQIDGLFTPVWRYLRKMSQGYTKTIVAGDWLAHRLKRFGLKDPQCVPFGIDKSFFSPKKRNDEMRQKLLQMCGRSEDCPLFITVSRFHPEKRLKTLFEAIRILNKEMPVAHVVFGEGLLSQKHRRYAKETSGVCLAGFTRNREELAQAYASSDLLLHGSAAETFGLSVAEGICSGLPVVGPNVGGVADLISDTNGITYKAGDASDCARAIRDVLAQGHSQWSQALAASVHSINSVDNHFGQLFDLYESLLPSQDINTRVMELIGSPIVHSQ
jgi:alpha-1,6-mannosyltransferase